VQVKDLALAGAAAAAVAVLLIRSGNSGAEWLKPDSGMRQFLEDLLVIRPRTKEFLIGQPLLFLGFYWKRPWLIILGMIGQVSLVNTFLHAHSPVMVSLIRTFHGVWLGLLIGAAAAGLSFLAGMRGDGRPSREQTHPERQGHNTP
ncbi:MAG: DUF5693 family protein, partial [Endomicrobiales bacterium]